MSTPETTATAPPPPETSIPASDADGISTTLKTGQALFLLQLFSRLVTFALNQSLVRLASPAVFGTAAIQFDLVTGTILFLSREGIRNALLRFKPAPDSGASAKAGKSEKPATTSTTTKDQSHSLASVPLLLSIPITAVILTTYLWFASPETVSQSSFHLALSLYIIGTLLKIAVEPAYVMMLTSEPPALRLRGAEEGGMAVIKALVTCGMLIIRPQDALLGFAVGELLGSIWSFGVCIRAYGTEGLASFDWIFSSKGNGPQFDPALRSLAIANTRQSVIKHLLSEGDRIAVTRICPLQEQGGYAVALNYGSLIARVLFQPLEETLKLHFSKNPPATSPSAGPILTFVLHISSHLLLFLPSFLPPLLPPLLLVILPRQYLHTAAPRVLGRYILWYLPLMSLNGILEAFHTATATPHQVALQERWMLASSGTFVATLYLFLETAIGETLAKRLDLAPPPGARSDAGGNELVLIAANCVGMVVRILYAAWHAYTTLGSKLEFGKLLPKSSTTLAALFSGVALRQMHGRRQWWMTLYAWFQMVGAGATLTIITLGVMWKAEQEEFKLIRQSVKTSVKTKKE